MEDIEMIDSSEKEDSTFWTNLDLDTFKWKYPVGCSDLFIRGLRVIDEEVIQEMIKIEDNKSRDLSNFIEFRPNWVVTKSLEHKKTDLELKDQFKYELDKLLKLIDQESVTEELETKLNLQVRQNIESDLDSKIGCMPTTTKKVL